MSKLKQLMVQEKTLAELSKEIDLTKDIKLGSGERKNNGIYKESIRADIFESFIAALYLSKGIKQTSKFLQLSLFSWIKGKENLIWDYKTQLQEYCQSQKNLVEYKILRSDLKKKNLFLVTVEDKLKTFKEQGEGRSRKKAEQEAAFKVLKKFKLI